MRGVTSAEDTSYADDTPHGHRVPSSVGSKTGEYITGFEVIETGNCRREVCC